MPYEVISSRKIFSGDFISFHQDRVKYPSGHVGVREILTHPGAVGVIGITADGKIPLVRQYRHATGGMILEIPAGIIDPGENIEDCARREFQEEVGGEADTLSYLGWFYTTAGYSSEKIHIYYAEHVTLGDASPEDGEEFDIELFTLEEALSLIDSGELTDAKTVIAVLKVAAQKNKKAGSR